jgi:hypothetical protein
MKHYALSLLLFAFIPYLNDYQGTNELTSTNNLNSTTSKMDGPNLLRLAVDIDMFDLDPCFRHGGTVAAGLNWNIATCKSNCTRGLGFRCGGENYIRCGDGTVVIVGVRDDSCPHDKSRQISADFSFYDNNTLSFTFLSPLPEEEKENNDFEIEDDITFSIPDYLLVGDRHYSSYTVKKGTYKVDRTAGEFGEVSVDITLNN